MIASNERQIDSFKDRPSTKKYIEHFDFPELKDKSGIFIIEIIGNGMSARAIIKKGSLQLIVSDITVAGNHCYILDEKRQICAGPDTGVYF
jgi:hypothetical protein